MSSVPDLNRYGIVTLLCVLLGFGAIPVADGRVLSIGLFGLAALTVVRAIAVNDEPDRYPQDRDRDRSEDTSRRQKEMEGEKGGAMGEY